MRIRIFGAIGVIWGGFILANALFRGTAAGGNAAHQAGQYVGLGFGRPVVCRRTLLPHERRWRCGREEEEETKECDPHTDLILHTSSIGTSYRLGPDGWGW